VSGTWLIHTNIFIVFDFLSFVDYKITSFFLKKYYACIVFLKLNTFYENDCELN